MCLQIHLLIVMNYEKNLELNMNPSINTWFASFHLWRTVRVTEKLNAEAKMRS